MGDTGIYDVIVLGSGLAGLTAVNRLLDGDSNLNIAIVGNGYGATPYIAALNAVFPDNPWGDTPAKHQEDMLEAGFYINDKMLVSSMCSAAGRCVKFLQDWDVQFAKTTDKFLLRHASGSSYPRSLCRTTEVLGMEIINKLRERLWQRGVEFINSSCLQLFSKDGEIEGVSINDYNINSSRILTAPVVILAWGGVGNLFPDSTYPEDIDGRTLAMAFNAGVSLIDLEFLEFEPLIVKWPPQIKGEPCPTAMLGEGAYLLNNDKERFILPERPEGEAGSPKTFLNQAIIREISAGRGSANNGIYADLRHLPIETLKAYPWFYEKVVAAGIDPKEELLEVGPAAHSHSGGVLVDSSYQTEVDGLYAVGEAVGGLHGACRLAGNAATQALVSGILAAEGILGKELQQKQIGKIKQRPYQRDRAVAESFIPEIKSVAAESLGFNRKAKTLTKGIKKLEDILDDERTKNDSYTRQLALSALLIARSCYLRTETRGSHKRLDYPLLDNDWQCSIKLFASDKGEIEWEKINRGE